MSDLEDKNIKKVLNKTHDIEKILNDGILIDFISYKNINKKYNKIKLKQEVIAKNACFLTKKKYGLYIINKEGKSVSEYDIKGMVTRRSNFPRLTKERVLGLLDIILKEDKLSKQKIEDYIVKVRNEMIEYCKNNYFKIAGPVSYNKYKHDYKNGVIPSHVQAMELWNTLEYKYFVKGTKGYLFRIKGIDTNNPKVPKSILNKLDKMSIKNTRIVLPDIEEYLPEYYIVDVEAQMQFCWEERYNEILKFIYGSANDFIQTSNSSRSQVINDGVDDDLFDAIFE